MDEVVSGHRGALATVTKGLENCVYFDQFFLVTVHVNQCESAWHHAKNQSEIFAVNLRC